jgi:hypothetical protein
MKLNGASFYVSTEYIKNVIFQIDIKEERLKKYNKLFKNDNSN